VPCLCWSCELLPEGPDSGLSVNALERRLRRNEPRSSPASKTMPMSWICAPFRSRSSESLPRLCPQCCKAVERWPPEKTKIARREETSRHFLLSQTNRRKSMNPLILAQTGFGRYWPKPSEPALRGRFPTGGIGADRRRAFVALVIRRTIPGNMDGRARLRRAGRGRGMPGRGLPRRRRFLGCRGIRPAGRALARLPCSEGLDAARRLQEQVRLHTGHTVTIGVAAHPTLDYSPQEALENARKAAEHAAFFGPNSRVAFDAVSLNISGDQCYERGTSRPPSTNSRRPCSWIPKTSTSTTASGCATASSETTSGAGGVCACALAGKRRVHGRLQHGSGLSAARRRRPRWSSS